MDDRYLLIEGRRWRRSDPALPPDARQAMVNRLMAARRSVWLAVNASEERAARRSVHLAKVALGERGTPWWEGWDVDRSDAIRATLADWSPDAVDELIGSLLEAAPAA